MPPGASGDENLAREYGQVYDRVEELFERLTGLLGDEKAERKSYAQILMPVLGRSRWA